MSPRKRTPINDPQPRRGGSRPSPQPLKRAFTEGARGPQGARWIRLESERQALVTWSKEGDRLRHLGYQKATADGDLAFECRFLPSGDQDILVLRIGGGRNLEIRRVASGDRVTFVRLDADPLSSPTL